MKNNRWRPKSWENTPYNIYVSKCKDLLIEPRSNYWFYKWIKRYNMEWVIALQINPKETIKSKMFYLNSEREKRWLYKLWATKIYRMFQDWNTEEEIINYQRWDFKAPQEVRDALRILSKWYALKNKERKQKLLDYKMSIWKLQQK